MWKHAAVAAALVALAGGCEDRTTRTTTNGRVAGDGTRTTTTTETLTTPRPEAAQPDTMFLRTAASINDLEIDLAKLALDNSQNADVRAFAEMLRKDHENSGKQLKDITAQIRVEFPSDMLQEHRATKERLRDLKGPQFDREFCRIMVEGHQQAIDLFQTEATEGRTQELKTYAQGTLPTLRQHLDQARELQKKVSAAGEPTDLQPGMPPAGDQPEVPKDNPPSGGGA